MRSRTGSSPSAARSRATVAATRVVTVMVLVLLAACTGFGPATPSTASSAGGSPHPTSTPAATPAARPTSSATSPAGGTSGTSSTSGTSPTSRPTSTSPLAPNLPRVGHSAWVAVSVATVWRSPAAPRAVDRPVLTNPARVRAWLAALTVPLRRDLSNRADTQVLLGDRVVVLARSGSWAKVVVPDQPTPLDARGYPGWVPVAQLTGSAPASSARTATVVARTAWLRSDDGRGRALVEISFGTRLPLVTAASGEVRVVVPGGGVMRIAAADVSVTRTGTPALPAEGRALVRTVTMFTGLPYLWAGTSGFGFDCSGLTWLALRTHGVTIARDAAPQSVAGRPVPTSAVEPGDLLFFADAGVVHHVGVYAGSGRMTHAPGTGRGIETVSLSAPPYADELVRARRYVG